MADGWKNGVTTELDPTFVWREMVLDQVVAEVVAQVQRRGVEPVDAA